MLGLIDARIFNPACFLPQIILNNETEIINQFVMLETPGTLKRIAISTCKHKSF